MKTIKILIILLILSLTTTSTIINEDDLVIKVNILNINSTSASLEYIIIPGDSKDDYLYDIITNTNDLDLDYKIKNLYYTINNDNNNYTVVKKRFKDQILITNLTTSSKYNILFTLEYDDKSLNLTNQTIKSDLIEFYTYDKCNCKLNTTINECSSDKCQCKSCYEGLSCSKCKIGCYLNHTTQECKQCPCDLDKSSGECMLTNRDYSIIKCTSCILPNIGLLCDKCDTYYYKSVKHNGLCLPCMCNDNTDSRAKRHCEDSTGECIGCINNTTGKYCDQCLDGYVGNALNQTCISLNDSLRMQATLIEPYRMHMPMDYRSLFVFTLLIFAVLFTILSIVYYCNKFNSSTNEQLSLFHPFNRIITNFKQRNNKFNGMFTFKRRFMANNNNDDDLNLAENQIFDECLFTDDFYYANQPNANNLLQESSPTKTTATTSNTNPYTNLTISA